MVFVSAAVDACLSHRLKKRVGGLLSSNSTDSLINKFAKYDEDAGEIAKQCHDVQDTVSRTSSFSGMYLHQCSEASLIFKVHTDLQNIFIYIYI